MTRRNVTAFTNTADGPALRWQRNCGQRGTLGRNGSIADGSSAQADETTIPVAAHTHR
jgi:hypothetical protein